jgi:hypothetical protein
MTGVLPSGGPPSSCARGDNPTSGRWVRRTVEGATVALRRAGVGLERLHSGHVGDYVAWLLLGVAAIGAAVLVPVRG